MSYTPEQLAGMTDFEINKALADRLGYSVAEIDDSSPLGMTSEYHKKYPDTVWISNRAEAAPWEQMCWTGEWSDTGPLMVEHGVSLLLPPKSMPGHIMPEASHKEIVVFRANPLRAVCEVLLQMPELSCN